MADRADRQGVFVCQHGAFRSRIAAANSNAAAPKGWSAASAGITPQAELSSRLVPLMTGTGVESHIGVEPPHRLSGLAPNRIVAIDADVPGAETWRTDQAVTDEDLREEIREQVARAVTEVDAEPVL